MAISDAEFDSLSNVLSDPEKASRLSPNQLEQARDLLIEFRDERASRKQRFIDEGFGPEQIAKLDTEFKQAPEANTGAGRGSRGFQPIQVAGLAEGGKQAFEGVADLAKDLAVGMGAETEESRVQWKQGVTERRLKNRAEHIQTFGQLPPKSWEFMGQVAPWVAALPASAASFLGIVTKRVVQGGTIGATGFQAEGDTLVDRALNTAIGVGTGGVSSAFAIPTWFKWAGAKGFTRAFNDTTVKQREMVEELTRQMTRNPDFAFSLSQVTGSRFVFGLELSAASKATKEAQNRNLEILAKNLVKVARTQSSKGMSAGKIAAGLRTSLKDARTKIYKVATDEFDTGIKSIVDEFGDDVVVRGKDYLAKVDKLIGEGEDRLVSMGAKPSSALQDYRADVDKLVNPVVVQEKGNIFNLLDRRSGEVQPVRFRTRANAEAKALEINESFGGPTSDETRRIFRGLNKLIGGDTVIFENVGLGTNRNTGRALMGSLIDELESGSGNAAAIDAIKALREGYKAQMARAQALDDTVVSAAFGGKRLPRQPGKRLDQVLKSEKEDLVAVRGFLEEWNPQLLDDLRATHLTRIVRGSRRPTQPDVDTPVSLPKLANRLADGFGAPGQAGKGLHTAAVQADLVRTAKALRIINNKYFTGITPGGVRVEEVAINVISRSPEFMARFLTRALTGGQTVERAMLDPMFRRSIQIIAERGPIDRIGKAAMVYVASWINDNREVQERRQRAAAGDIAVRTLGSTAPIKQRETR